MPEGLKFAIPERLLVKKGNRDYGSFEQTRATVEVKGLKIDAIIFSRERPWVNRFKDAMSMISPIPMDVGETKVLKRLACQIINRSSVDQLEARLDDEIIPYFCYDSRILKDTIDKKEWLPAINAYGEELKSISAILGGSELVLIANSVRNRDPRSFDPDTYNIFIWTSPTGETTGKNIGQVFGEWIDKPEHSIWAPDSVPGRGNILYSDDEDGKKKSVVQIIENNIYLLVPLMDDLNSAKKAIFRRLVVSGLNYIHDHGHEPKPESRASHEEVSKFVEKAERGYTKDLESIIREYITEIDKLQQTLNAKISTMKQLLKVKSTMENMPIDAGKIARDVEKIYSDPRVDMIEIVENGIVVTTKQIFTEHDGIKYSTGVFAIRVNGVGRLSVWSEKSEHPKGHGHPHITTDTPPCFGNITRAVQEAAAEFRWADAIHYVLEWLTYGYAPELAIVSIEEWPSVIEDWTEDPVKIIAEVEPAL